MVYRLSIFDHLSVRCAELNAKVAMKGRSHDEVMAELIRRTRLSCWPRLFVMGMLMSWRSWSGSYRLPLPRVALTPRLDRVLARNGIFHGLIFRCGLYAPFYKAGIVQLIIEWDDFAFAIGRYLVVINTSVTRINVGFLF